MATGQVSKAAIERLAKTLAENDNFEWQLEFKLPLPSGAKRRYRPLLDEAGRERYRTRAREQIDHSGA
jgi:hypothetical protein